MSPKNLFKIYYSTAICGWAVLEILIYSIKLGNSSSATAPALLYYMPSMALCITLVTAIHGLVRFLCSVRPQLTAAHNDLEQVLNRKKSLFRVDKNCSIQIGFVLNS